MKADLYKLPGTIQGILGKLAKIRAEDKIAEKKSKLFGCLSGISFVVTFLSIFGAVALESFAILFVTATLFVTGIVMVVKYVQHKRHDLEDRKIDIPHKVLSVLRVDVPANEKIELSVDFLDYRKGGTLEGQDKAGMFGGTSTAKYDHDWLEMKIKLADGSLLQLRAADQVSRKEKRKRKYTKVKERFTGRIEMVIRLGKKRYGDMQIAERLGELAPPKPLRLKFLKQDGPRVAATLMTGSMVRSKGRYGTQTTGEGNALSADQILNSLMWLYDGIGSQKKAA